MTDVAVVATVAAEPAERLERMLRSVRDQTMQVSEIVIACPPADVDVVRRAAGRAGVEVVMVENPSGARSAGLNLALRTCGSGVVVVRVDARSTLALDHVGRCAARLEDLEVGVVGGHQVPQATNGPAILRGIGRAVGNPLVVGGPAYRSRSASGEVDTVYLGAYRCDELLAIGGWDEGLKANEDFDLCRRYRERGQKVWLEEGLNVSYEPRESLAALFSQYHQFGQAKRVYWRRTHDRPNGRQAAAMMLAAAVGCGLALSRTRRPAVLLAGAATVVADAVGGGAGTPTERAFGSLSSALMISGWLSGVVRESLFPSS